MTDYIAIIFARGGSKGIPGKNLLDLNGKPLVAWSIESAKKINKISRIIVSTDSEEIAEVALKFGAEIPFLRPSELSLDKSSEWGAWQHAVRYLRDKDPNLSSGFISLPPTSPLRSIEDIQSALNLYESGDFDIILSYTKTNKNPYFNMIKKNEFNSSIHLAGKLNTPIFRRQDAPEMFELTTSVYVTNFDYIINNNQIFSGKVGGIEVPRIRSIDIDDFLDFEVCKTIINSHNLDQNE